MALNKLNHNYADPLSVSSLSVAGNLAIGGTESTGAIIINGTVFNPNNITSVGTLSSLNVTGTITSGAQVTGTTPANAGSTGGLVVRAPASGPQTNTYIQFVNNANTIQLGMIYVDSSGNMVIAPANSTLSVTGNLVENINTTAKTAAYAIATTDYGTTLQMNGAFAFTVGTTLSAAPVGTKINLVALTTGVSVAASGVTIYYTPGLKLRSQYSAASLVCLASNVWLLTGDLSA